MSADPENEYFSDGITEELLNTLTRIDGLQITSRTSSFAFKSRQDDIRDIAIKLNVDKILEGSVRKSGNKVRITAQLINAADGYHIWSEHYDRDLTDIFEVQDEISSIIANKLRENLKPSEKPQHLVKSSTLNIDAYTLYLKGLHFWNRLTPSDVRKAVEYFERAIAREPGYAQAYAMTACAYSWLGSTGQMNPTKAYEIVHSYADKALLLDNSVAEGHIAKGVAHMLHDWDFDLAYSYLKKALELNPNLAGAHQMMAFIKLLREITRKQ
jgi:TolB-like protein